MLLVLPFVVNALMNFALGLAVAWLIGPDAFGLYAIGAAILVFVNAAALDWLKLSAIRFYADPASHQARADRMSLDVLAAGVAMALAGLLCAAAVLGLDLRLPATLVGVAVAAGITAGLFDYSCAIIRAEGRDRAYAQLILAKNALSLVFVVGGAWLFGDPAVVLAGAGLSVLASLLTMRGAVKSGPVRPAALSRAQVLRFAAYALPLVGANVLMALMPLANRTAIAASAGLADSAYFSLAADMGVKLFGTLGATLEIVLLRRVLRRDARLGRQAAHDAIARNLAVIALVAAPVAAGLFLVMPQLELVIAPEAFRGPFGLHFAVLIPGFFALAVTQAGFNPVFMLAGRTHLATAATAVAGVVNAGGLWLALTFADPLLASVGLSAGLVAMLLVSAAMAFHAGLPAPPWRDIAFVVFGVIAMALAIWPLRGSAPAPAALAAMIAIGGFAYAATVLAGDVAGCRRHLVRYLRRRSAPAGMSLR
jgi:O-antigen/teichoic acid export membrane protein